MIKYTPTEDLIAAITSLYAYRSTAWNIAMKELKSRMLDIDYVNFCKQNGFVIY